MTDQFDYTLKNCPECGANWDAGDVFEVLRSLECFVNKTDEEIREAASGYGWTPEKPVRFSRLIGIEVPGDDRISVWVCPDCKARFPRFNRRKNKEQVS